ncbi:AAA family ATPase (plasmid) [Streptomyces sp. NBC_00445]|uniref:ParA family protein n=1 Tax=Streptomyces sp. NBC_00445 TaxID=2975745 RepID=UPI002E240285
MEESLGAPVQKTLDDLLELESFTDLKSRLEVVRRFPAHYEDEHDAMLAEVVRQIRPYLRNVIGVTIGKGGQGKTTLSANMAGMLAAEQERLAKQGKKALPILHLELDLQGDGLFDFGLVRSKYNDQGAGFAGAVTNDAPLHVIKTDRQFLHVVAAGRHNARIADGLASLLATHGRAAHLLLALLLAQISHLYRWIVIDFSPGDRGLQQLGLAAATHLTAPLMDSDNASVRGLANLAVLAKSTRKTNPELGVAAMCFLGFRKVQGQPTSDLTIVWEKLRTALQGHNVSPDVILDDYVREGRVLAKEARNSGMLAHEFASAAAGQWTDPLTGEVAERPRDENGRLIEAKRALDIANDHAAMARAVITRVRTRNLQLKEATA